MTEPLTEAEVKAFVTDWYRKLDAHAPIEEVIPLVADEGLVFTIPEGTRRSHDEMRVQLNTWYTTFFDEVHAIRQLDVTLKGDKAEAKLVVNWKARIWKPPAAKSRFLHFNAYQTWVVICSEATGNPVIKTYIVNTLDALADSAPL